MLKAGVVRVERSRMEALGAELGRRLFGYTKPDDHYHPAASVEETLARALPLARRRYFPVNVPRLAVFSLGRFVKPGTAGQEQRP
jgi:hypothetical protein